MKLKSPRRSLFQLFFQLFFVTFIRGSLQQ